MLRPGNMTLQRQLRSGIGLSRPPKRWQRSFEDVFHPSIVPAELRRRTDECYPRDELLSARPRKLTRHLLPSLQEKWRGRLRNTRFDWGVLFMRPYVVGNHGVRTEAKSRCLAISTAPSYLVLNVRRDIGAGRPPLSLIESVSYRCSGIERSIDFDKGIARRG